MYTPQEKYRSTELYRTLVSAGSITPSGTHEDYKFIPNHKPTGITWDAKHLDKFITNPKYGSMTTTSAASKQNTLAKELTTTMSGGSLKKTSLQGTLKSQASHYFKSGPRWTADREKAYLINFSKDFTIKEARNNTNNLVTNSKTDQPRLEQYYTKEYGGFDKTFDPSKLEFSIQGTSLVSPQERRVQLQEIKQNQIEMLKWKEKKKEMSKKYRVYKNGFKSGILGLDNPTNDETLMYKEEHKVIAEMKQNVKNIEARRLDQLKNLTKTNSLVEFYNRNFDIKTTEPLNPIVSRNAKKSIDMAHTNKWRNTTDRLFGQHEISHSVERANYLKSQETKGRNWDILSFANIRNNEK